MNERKPLAGCRILIVEDEFLIAMDLESSIARAGGTVVGPANTLEAAMAAVSGKLDGAVLDVNLRGKMVFPVADALAARHVPFVFTTGYDDGAIPERFSNAARCGKPVAIEELLEYLRPKGARKLPQQEDAADLRD